MIKQLSKRLQTVADWVPKGARLLDVGSDHAYLPIELLEQEQINFAIAGEVVEGPYQSAVANVASHGLKEQIEVRLADGLAAFEPSDDISCITICGMGGRLIASILENGRAKLDGVDRLILQPNNCEDDLRSWLRQNGFFLTAEQIVLDHGKYYEIMVASAGHMTLTKQEERFGPYLMQEKSAVFVAKWQRELDKLEQALTQIPDSNPAAKQSLLSKRDQIKEVLIE